jgi:GGDEF domain-containing protein
LIILGIDNLAALEDLFGEPLGDEIIEAVQARIAPALPPQAKRWRAEHRRIALSIPQLDRTGVSALVNHLQITIAQQAVPTSQGPVAVTLAAGCVVDDDHPPEAEARQPTICHNIRFQKLITFTIALHPPLPPPMNFH